MRHEDYLAAENRAELHIENAPGVWSADFERAPDALAPAGGISSNVVDLAQWLRITLAQGQPDGEQVIDADALALTKEPRIDTGPGAAYGLGWNIRADETGETRWKPLRRLLGRGIDRGRGDARGEPRDRGAHQRRSGRRA